MKLKTSSKQHRGTKKKEEEREEELMELLDETCFLANAANAAAPVQHTEELLRAFFTDESHHMAMNSQQPSGLAEVRLVLLGRKGAGKSASGSTILGEPGAFESGKPTEECEKRRSDVLGRRVTVVDTPGWEWYYPYNGTPSWVKGETLRSVSLCPPGPHAVLLVVRSCASVTDAYISEMEEHLEPLGKEVWDHMMLIFTRGDELGLVKMDQRILAGGPALRRLLKRCGHRYHALNNRSKDLTQVTELMKKLEEMVEEKHGGHLGLGKLLEGDLEEEAWRRARERRKKQRQMEALMQRGTIKAALTSECLRESELDAHNSFSKSSRRLPEVRLVVLGERETGKSTAGNTILGNTDFFEAGHVTEECRRKQAEVSMRQVTVVDTPGWEGGAAGTTLERVKREIVGSVSWCPPGPHAFLLTLRVDSLVRAGHLKEHLELLGEGVWRHTMLMFTHVDQLREDVDVDLHIRAGGRDVEQLLEKCRGRYHVLSRSHHHVTSLLEKVEKMAAANRCEAFSELVVEIQTLSWQRTERFNHHVKEVAERMQRQEVELKRMREKEMKGIMWFFDRKRKLKQKGKSRGNKEEEQEEDGQLMSERRNDMSELEERIRWLTEDKEREIQDLGIEKERLRAALSQNTQARDKAERSLQLKDRQIEELKERIDELRLQILDLEKMAEGIQKDNDGVKEAQMMELEMEVRSMKDEISGMKRNFEDTLHRKEHENKIQICEIELKLQERETEMEGFRHMQVQHRKEMEDKDTVISEVKLKYHIEMDKIQTERVLHEKEVDEWKQKCVSTDNIRRQYLDDINEMQQKHHKYIAELTAEHTSREVEGLEKMEKSLKDNEIHFFNYQNEKENEVSKLKAQHMKDMEGMKSKLEKLQLEVTKHVDEKEKMRQQHRDNITDVKKESQEEIVKVLQQSQRMREELEQEYTAKIKNMQLEEEKQLLKIKEEQNVLLKQRIQVDEELKKEHVTRMKKMEEETSQEIQKQEEKYKQSKQRLKESEEKQHKVLQEQHKIEIQELQSKFNSDLQQTLMEREELEQKYNRKEAERQSQLVIYQKEMEELKERLSKSQAREINHLSYKDSIEQRLKEKNQDIKLMKLDMEQMKEKRQKREEEEEVNNSTQLKRQMETLEMMEQKLEMNEKITKRLQQHINHIDQILPFREGVSQRKERTCVLGQLENEMKLDDSCKTSCRENTKNEVLLELADGRIKEILQLKSALEERGVEIEEATKMMGQLLEDMSKLRETNTCLSSRVLEMQQRREEELQENEEQMKQFQQREEENKKEIVQLRMTIELTKSDLIKLTARMETEMTGMIQGYEEEMERIQTENRRLIEREREVQEKNDEMRREAEEIEDLKKRMEEMKEREQVVGELQVKLEKMKQKEKEIESLKAEIERMKETEEVKLEKVKNSEEEVEGLKMKLKKLMKREREDEVLKVQMEEMREKEKEVEGLKVKVKEEEKFTEWKRELQHQNECMIRETKEQKHREFRMENRAEQDLESLMRSLEVKQQELTSHGQDLQRKVKSLNDQGQELKDKEMLLRSEERELLHWQTELQKQSQTVTETRQQLEDMSRGLASLKEQLQTKEENLKKFFKKLSSWQRDLEEREAMMDRTDHGISVERHNDDLMCEEVREEAEVTRTHSAQGHKKGISEDHQETMEPEIQGVEKEPKWTTCLNGSRTGSSPGQVDLEVLLLREHWSTRSPAGVTILGAEAPSQAGSGFQPWRGQIAGHRLAVAEPLGLKWRDGPDPQSPEQQRNILDSILWCHPGPRVVLILIPAFINCTKKYRRAVEEHVGLVGEKVWSRAMVVFTWGETLSAGPEQHILRNGELQDLVNRCGGRYHMLTNRKSNSVDGLLEKMEDIAIKTLI